MANVMLTSESKDPSKPFKIRIQELKSRYEDVLVEMTSVLQENEQHVEDKNVNHKELQDQLILKLEMFNAACDEVYKEVQRRRQRCLIAGESMQSTEENVQSQSAGFLTQLMADFRVYLETGVVQFVKLDKVLSE